MGRLLLHHLILFFHPQFLPTSRAERLEFELSDPDVCPLDGLTRTINIHSQAVVFNLDGAGYNQTLPRKCRLLVKTSRGEGVMVYAATAYLRPGAVAGCIDYIQFGEDDFIPFITYSKSEKLCNNKSGWSYEAKEGSLLIWLSLGDPRPQTTRESFLRVKLRIVITAFKKTPIFNSYRECGARGHFIHESYFCDGQPNCAVDEGPEGPLDESDRFCAAVAAATAQPGDDEQGTDSSADDMAFDKKEDLRLGTIIAISLGVVVMLATTAVCCVRKCGKVHNSHPQQQYSTNGEFCTDIRLHSLHHPTPSSSTRRGHSYERRTGGGSSLAASEPPPAIAAIPEEPPPAYSDIFPADYQYKKDESSQPP